MWGYGHPSGVNELTKTVAGTKKLDKQPQSEYDNNTEA